MNLRHNYLTFFLLLLLVICRVGAVAHAAEHTFEHDDEYCEICALTDHNSDGLVPASGLVQTTYQAIAIEFYQSPQFLSQNVWDYQSRAPPVNS